MRSLINFLTPVEWRIAAKLAAILLLALTLLQASISLGYPAAQFIYGRF